MEFTFYAESNGGTLYALPSSNSSDTVRNGWLIKDTGYADSSFSGKFFNAECFNGNLFVEPKQFGCETLSFSGINITIEILPIIIHDNYCYKNLPIGGGGFVTGFAFDDDGYLFCRTDIGGCYSSAPDYSEWTALSHNADFQSEWLCNPLSIICKNNVMYALFGNRLGSFLGISHNKGKSFTFHTFPEYVHGNCLGRATGERIAIISNKIYIGTRGGGLLCSILESKLNWEKICITDICGDTLKMPCNDYSNTKSFSSYDDISLVHAFNSSTLIIGTTNNFGVFVSYNNCKSFEQLDIQPEADANGNPFIAQRAAIYGDFLFITFSCSSSDRTSKWYSYACDGGRIYDGKVYRYQMVNGKFKFSADITPQAKKGFSGIDISSDGKYLVCTTVCCHPDNIYISYNFGDSWKEILSDKSNAVQNFRTPYMEPQNNNGISVIHWMSDIKICPSNSSFACINTGTGVFCTRNLGDNVVVWEDFSNGIEETVHLSIYSPPSGKVQVIDVVGDLGGFAFTDIDKECEFTFRDENHNRYITAINADFAESKPEIAVVSPRGNWNGTSKGGAAISFDGGINWNQLSNPYGLNKYSDRLLEKISQPNINPGWVAISCSGKAIIRQIADDRLLPFECTAVTFDLGKSWTKCNFFSFDNELFPKGSLYVKIFSDRLRENIFYAFGNNGQIFVSLDSGKSFMQCKITGELPYADFSSIEEHISPDIRVSPYNSGEILLCYANNGIFKLNYSNGNTICSESLIPTERCTEAYCAGYGKGNVIFLCGTIDGIYGFWRSYNGDWIKINDKANQFGQIRSICGDPRAYGRFYIATGSFGAVYGELNTK